MLPGVLTSDSELIGELLVNEYGDEPRSDGRDLEHALEQVLPRLAGAFSLVLMDEAHVFGVRDRHGFRPLVLGRTEGGWVLASETAALDIVGAHFVRDVEPGEMVAIDADRRAVDPLRGGRRRSCASSSSSTSRAPTRSSTARACTARASAWARSSPARRPSRPTW